MGDDDLIAGLQASVRKEVIERYVRERLILEEEINMVLEAASAWHGGWAALEAAKRDLAFALIEEEAGRSFFRLANLLGYRPPEGPRPGFIRPRAWRRWTAYQKLVARLYAAIHADAHQLVAERDRVLALMEEVNQDILHFESTHDMMAISAYLRSLDPAELQRRKLLGVNFTAKEKAMSAEGLSFRPMAVERLELQNFAPVLGEPAEVMKQAEPLLRGVCRRLPQEVDRLWA